jgi:hypothetical protein
MPAGRFSPQETLAASRRMHAALNRAEAERFIQETRLQMALQLIKRHIGPFQSTVQAQNEDLGNAIQLIVDFARKHGHLER